jgi:hypothetical protein
MRVCHSRYLGKMTAAGVKGPDIREDSTPLSVNPGSGAVVSPAAVEHTDEETGTEGARGKREAFIATKVKDRKLGKKNGSGLEKTRSLKTGTETFTKVRRHLGSGYKLPTKTSRKP